MKENSFLNSVKAFCQKTYGDKMFIKDNETYLWMQYPLGEMSQYFPTVNETHKMIKERAINYEYLCFDLYSNGHFHCYLWGYEPDGLVEDPEFQNQVDHCFSFRLDQVEELRDVINYIQKVALDEDFQIPDQPNFGEVKLPDLIEDNYVFVPALSTESMLPYNVFKGNFSIDQVHDNIEKLRRPSFCGNLEESNARIEEDRKQMEEKKKSFIALAEGSGEAYKPGDIFIKINREKSYEVVGYYDVSTSELEGNGESFLVFRPKAGTSFLGLADFLGTTKEGEELIKRIVEKDLSEDILYLGSTFEQTRYAIEHRTLNFRFRREFERMLETRESFAQKNQYGYNRLQQLEAFYSSACL